MGALFLYTIFIFVLPGWSPIQSSLMGALFLYTIFIFVLPGWSPIQSSLMAPSSSTPSSSLSCQVGHPSSPASWGPLPLHHLHLCLARLVTHPVQPHGALFLYTIFIFV